MQTRAGGKDQGEGGQTKSLPLSSELGPLIQGGVSPPPDALSSMRCASSKGGFPGKTGVASGEATAFYPSSFGVRPSAPSEQAPFWSSGVSPTARAKSSCSLPASPTTVPSPTQKARETRYIMQAEDEDQKRSPRTLNFEGVVAQESLSSDSSHVHTFILGSLSERMSAPTPATADRGEQLKKVDDGKPAEEKETTNKAVLTSVTRERGIENQRAQTKTENWLRPENKGFWGCLSRQS